MRKWAGKLSIRLKATLFVMAVVVLSLAAIAAVVIVRTNAAIAREQRRAVDYMADSLARASELAVAVGDQAELTRLVRSFLRDSHIVFVAIYDSSGRLIASAAQDMAAWRAYEATGAETKSFLLGRTPVQLANSLGLISLVDDGAAQGGGAARPVPSGKPATIGMVAMALSTQPMRQAQRAQAKWTLITVGVTALCVGAIVLLAVNGWTRRLKALVAASERIASGDYDHLVYDRLRDEIGRLALAYESMRQALRQRESELREFNDTLQQQVEQRTKDFAEAKEAAEAARWRTETVNTVIAEVSRQMEPTRIADVVASLVANAMQLPWCAVVLRKPWKQLQVQALWREGRMSPQGAHRDAAKIPGLAQALATGQPVTVAQADAQEAQPLGPGPYVVLPLAMGQEPLGALAVPLPGETGVYSDQDMTMLQSVSSHISQALKNVMLVRELDDARTNLEQRVAERTVEVIEANHRIQQAQAELVEAEKMGMLGQLAAGVAHEINTPTGAILNVVADVQEHLRHLMAAKLNLNALNDDARRWLEQMIPKVLRSSHQYSEASLRVRRRDLEQELRKAGYPHYRRIASVAVTCLRQAAPPPQFLEYLRDETVLSVLEHVSALSNSAQICASSAGKIARIVRALRFYSRSGGQGELADVDVSESVDNCLVILQNRIKHLASVKTDYSKEMLIVRCGPEISQVWTNILNNACDAAEDLGEKAQGLIQCKTFREDDKAVVEIFDNGKPIPNEVISKIFDPFFTTKPVGKGTGLGLSICSGIVQRAGGSISARNEPDGVVFRVALPLAKAGGAQEAEKVSAGAPAAEPSD